MKKPLHPAALAVAAAALVALLVGVFVRFGSEVPDRSETASPYANFGDRPKAAGSGVNAITGEPLSPSAKAYTNSSFEQQNRR